MLWSEKLNKGPVSLREFLNTASMFACRRTAPCWHSIHRPGPHLRKQTWIILSLQSSYLLKHYVKKLASSKCGSTVLLLYLWQMRCSFHRPGSNTHALLLTPRTWIFLVSLSVRELLRPCTLHTWRRNCSICAWQRQFCCSCLRNSINHHWLPWIRYLES